MSSDKKEKKQPKGDYSVGYARPPRRSQFKKGQSGNRKGRPKRKPGERSKAQERVDFLEFMNGTFEVRINGVTRVMQRKEAVLMQTFIKAMNGDHRSQKYLLDKYEGSINVEEAIREAKKNAIPDKIQVRFVKSDGFGRPHPDDRDIVPGYKGPKPILREIKLGGDDRTSAAAPSASPASPDEKAPDGESPNEPASDEEEEDWLK